MALTVAGVIGQFKADVGRVLSPQAILAAVGLYSVPVPGRRPRDRSFPQHVLAAYEHQCAVCGFDLRLSGVTIALEAAHVRWHQAGGPDEVNNGLALCVLHHKMFDKGAWTATAEGVVQVSDQATGTTRLLETLFGYREGRLQPPQWPHCSPARGPPNLAPQTNM
jgi:putative restriction endonuclease